MPLRRVQHRPKPDGIDPPEWQDLPPAPRAHAHESGRAALPTTAAVAVDGMPFAHDDQTTAPGRRTSNRSVKKRTVDAVHFADVNRIDGRTKEGKMLKLALQRSMVETKLTATAEMPTAKTFYPTREEFANPIKYIARYWQTVGKVFFHVNNVGGGLTSGFDTAFGRRPSGLACARLCRPKGGTRRSLWTSPTRTWRLRRGSSASMNCRYDYRPHLCSQIWLR